MPVRQDRRNITLTKKLQAVLALCATVVQEVEKSFSNQKVASSIPCRSVLEQDTDPLIAPDVQCAISVNVKCVYMCKSHICKSLWIKASAKCTSVISIPRIEALYNQQ